jgi:hypothetical protein
MARVSPALTNFNGGEVGPLLSGRTDFDKYASSCFKMERFIPTVQGPAKRCPGTRFVIPTKYPDKASYLKRFEFSFDQAYALEFGDYYVRFYTDRGVQVTDGINITNITNASVGVLTYDGADPSNGDWFQVRGVEGMTELNGSYIQVANVNVGTKTFELKDTAGNDIDTTNFNAYVYNGDLRGVYEIASPYAAADLVNPEGGCALSVTQSGDVLYIGCPGYEPRTLTRFGATNWQFAVYQPNDGPFQATPADTKVFQVNSISGFTTVTCTTSVFVDEHAGMLFRFEPINSTTDAWQNNVAVTVGNLRKSDGKIYKAQNSGTTGSNRPIHEEGVQSDGVVRWQYQNPGYVIVRIETVLSTTQATATIIGPGNAPNEMYITNAECLYRIGAWGTAPGAIYPYKTAFFRNRLVWAGEQQVFASVTGDYGSHAVDTQGLILADNAISMTLAVGNVDKVRWMSASDVLLVGTAGSEIAIEEVTTTQAFGPENFKFTIQSAEGSREVDPVLVEDSVLFVRIGGRRIMELRFDIQADAWVPRDMNVLYPEIAKVGIVEMSYQKEPDNVIWCVLKDGGLIGMTYNREQNVFGWHRHPIAGPSAKVKSVQVISGPAGDVDDVWMIVERNLPSANSRILAEDFDFIVAEDGSKIIEDAPISIARYVEYFVQPFEELDDIQTAVYLDSSLEYNGAVDASLLPGVNADVKNSTNVLFTSESFYELTTEADEVLITEAGDELVTTDDPFLVTDVGREIHYRYYSEEAGQWLTARALITAYLAPDQVRATIIAPFPTLDTITANEWRLSTTTVQNLWHLEGERITGLIDGEEVESLIVNNGQVTTPRAFSRGQFGIPYTSKLVTQRIDAGATDGTAQGKVKRIHQIILRLYASLGGKMGSGPEYLDDILYRRLSDYMDEVPPVLTGDTDKTPYYGGYEEDGRVWIEADQPLPMTVVAIYPRMQTE